MKVSTLIRRMDIFGVPITFVGLNRLKYQTKLGGIVSLFLIGWLSYNVIIQFITLISMNKMVVTNTVQFSDDPSSILVDNKNFMFALKISQTDQINNPYITFSLDYIIDINGTNQVTLNIPLLPCKIQDFQQLYFYNQQMNDALIQNQIETWVCPQLNQSYSLQGKFMSPKFEYFQIRSTSCQSGNYTYNCPTQQQTEDWIQQSNYLVYIQLLITNVNVDPSSQNSFVGYIDTSYYMLLNPLQQYGEVDLFLKSWNVYTNPSIIDSNQLKGQNFIIHNDLDVIEKMVTRPYNFKDNICEFYIRNSQQSNTSNRSFVGLGDFLAYVGGLFGSLYTIANTIMSVYAYEQLWLKLFKIYYNLIAEDYNCKNLNQIIDQKFASSNILIPKLKSFFMICYKKARQNVVTYFQSQEIILEDLSIISFLRMQKDIQKMKNILFTQKQQQILDLYSKDTIVLRNYQQQHSHKLEEGKQFLWGHQFQERTLYQYKKIMETFDELSQAKDEFQNQITKRMLNVFDKDLQFIITNGDKKYTTTRFTIEMTNFKDKSDKKYRLSFQKDITRLVNYSRQLNISYLEGESLLKSIFLNKFTIMLDDGIQISFEKELYHNQMSYTISINNKFKEYEMKIHDSPFLQNKLYVQRQHRLVLQIQEDNILDIDSLINNSLQITINNYLLHLNCSLSTKIRYQKKENDIPSDCRSLFYIQLENYRPTQLEILSYLFNMQRFNLRLNQNIDMIFMIENTQYETKQIQIYMNWPNSEIILNQLIHQKDEQLRIFQVIYDLFMSQIQ
ncbi:hypothetical protein pb186bvf_003405 [Paramecium bursaria]